MLSGVIGKEVLFAQVPLCRVRFLTIDNIRFLNSEETSLVCVKSSEKSHYFDNAINLITNELFSS